MSKESPVMISTQRVNPKAKENTEKSFKEQPGIMEKKRPEKESSLEDKARELKDANEYSRLQEFSANEDNSLFPTTSPSVSHHELRRSFSCSPRFPAAPENPPFTSIDYESRPFASSSCTTMQPFSSCPTVADLKAQEELPPESVCDFSLLMILPEHESIRRSYSQSMTYPATRSLSSLDSSSVASSCKTSLSMQIDRYGFLVDPSLCAPLPTEQATKRELGRIGKWEELLKQLDSLPSEKWTQKTRLIHRLFKGVPDGLRKEVWRLLVRLYGEGQEQIANSSALQKQKQLENSKDLQEQNVNSRELCEKNSTIRSNDDLQDQNSLESLFSSKPCGFERQIDVDIVRTLRDHVLFRDRYSVGQQRLFRILVAFANKHPEIGYCQGMSAVAATLLVYYAEQEAFCMFCKLFELQGLQGLYQHGFPLLWELFWIQEQLMARWIPSVVKHFAHPAIGITSNLYAAKWYLSLFLCFPQRIAMRLWDVFYGVGPDAFAVWCVVVLEAVGKVIVKMEFDPLLAFLCRPEEMFGCCAGLQDEDALFERFAELWERSCKSKHRSLQQLHALYQSK